MPSAGNHEWDVFVSHASEDKVDFVDAFVRALRSRGVRVWYDAFEIKLGDDFRQKMTEGLIGSRFGAVVVSPSFFKYWPENELSALHALESAHREKRILPIVLGLDWQELASRLPFLGGRACVRASDGVERVADAVVASLGNSPTPRPDLRTQTHGAPRPSQYFTGRDEDVQAVRNLLLRGHAAVSASIAGLAGIGKTELAINVVHELAKEGRFRGGIFWLPAEQPDLTATWGTTIADSLGVPEGPISDRVGNVLRDLSRRQEEVLVVLDNVTSWRDDSRPGPLPEGGHVTLLATTRVHGLGGPQFRGHRLRVLTGDAPRELLERLNGRELTAAPGLDELLEHLDGHSLALELAGAFLREFPGETPASYVARLKSDPTTEDEVSDQARHEQTVRRALDTTWEGLDEVGQRAWLVAACFAPESAGREISDACSLDQAARRALRRFHLIDSEPSGRWRMHRLTREFGRRAGSEGDRRRALRAFVDGVLVRSREIDLATGFRIYSSERSHFGKALARARESGLPEAERSLLQDRIGTALHSMGDLPAAKEILEKALESALNNLGEDHPSVATRRSNLAGVLQDLGDLPAAKELLEKALESALNNLGEDHPSVATSRSNLALVHKDLGDLPAAKELLEKALESALNNLGEDHPSVATSRSNLALVHKGLGDLPAAKELLEKALESALNNLGEDHPSVATSRSNLAGVLQDLGDLPAAKELLEKALESALNNLGEDHPSVATSRSNLAGVLQDLGDLPAAKELLEKALESDLNNLGEDHPSVATSRSNLAGVLQALGDLPAAKELLEKALESALNNLGEDHPSVATRRSNLALVHEALGDVPAAKELLEKALESALNNLGEDHPSVATRRYNLAGVLEAGGETPAALALIERCLRSARRGLGEHHPSVARIRAKLASLLAKVGDSDRARAQATQAMEDVSDQPEGSHHRRAVEGLTEGLV